MSDDSSRVRCRPDVIWDEVDGRLTVYNLTTRTILEMNSTAAFLWMSIVQGKDRGLAGLMAARYPQVDPSRISSDVAATLKQFAEANLIEVADGESRHEAT